MITIYCASWILPVSSPPIRDGALVVSDGVIDAIGERQEILQRFSRTGVRDLGDSAIVPGFSNAHTHLELTAMRGLLDDVEGDFPAWLKKLTVARLERMSEDDLYDSALWGACEAVRAGITSVGDSSDSALKSMAALRDVGLRGTVFQESFGPDAKLVIENFDKLREKVARIREMETPLVRAGVSPHAPYTVCAPQLELIAEFSRENNVPLMMHAAESAAEESLLRNGTGPFAENLSRRGIEWRAPGVSTIEYLKRHGILEAKPLLAHCIRVDAHDVDLLHENDANVAHCPRSNAKLGHGVAPLKRFLEKGVTVGLGSDSVASNNSCDLLAEARFAVLLGRIGGETANETIFSAERALRMATIDGAQALRLGGVVGELRVGLQADFAAIALNASHQIPSYDPVNTIVFSSAGGDVFMTVVAGRVIYEEGRVTTVDEERLRERMREIAGKIG